jgi:hypothetical protein
MHAGARLVLLISLNACGCQACTPHQPEGNWQRNQVYSDFGDVSRPDQSSIILSKAQREPVNAGPLY